MGVLGLGVGGWCCRDGFVDDKVGGFGKGVNVMVCGWGARPLFRAVGLLIGREVEEWFEGQTGLVDKLHDHFCY